VGPYCGGTAGLPEFAQMYASSIASRTHTGRATVWLTASPLHGYDLRRVWRNMRSVCHAIGPDPARFFVQIERRFPSSSRTR